MKFNLNELQIIERLLSNRLNADFDSEIDELLHKVRKQISNINYQINRNMRMNNNNQK